MYNHGQNQVTGPVSNSANLPLPEPRRRSSYDDEESRVSTDSDLDLTDFDDECGDDDVEDDYAHEELRMQAENCSTFSGVLIRRLRALEQQQQQPQPQQQEEDDVGQPGELIRPPLLAVADDSFSAKMHRVLKWTRSLPSSDTVSESSESNLCSPSTIPAAMLSSPSTTTPSTQSRKRRLSDALFPDDLDTTQHHHHHHMAHVLKRPRIAGVFSPSAPGSPFFSNAPRLHPFPISTPAAAAAAPGVADHNSRRSVLKSCDYYYNVSPPMAYSNAIANPSNCNPIGNVKLNVNVLVVSAQTKSATTIPSAQIGLTSRSDKNIHICAACDASFASSRCFIRHWHGASTPSACRAAVSYGLGLQ